ncbi:hypothetical protein O6H91_10G076200 [Diphasiastrum complanatum]|uniref:Uncharacterized protein n=1 Tax=Diphasiastrum complanatum TaxID=34168 RepID=A0ACC2CIB0_DIPCM|nr:hypothetical protein O6H91_10G076200 [Diphasiastrum complanatum]
MVKFDIWIKVHLPLVPRKLGPSGIGAARDPIHITYIHLTYISGYGTVMAFILYQQHSVVDYFMGSPSLIPFLSNFTVSPTTLSDHSFLSINLGSVLALSPSNPSHMEHAPIYTYNNAYTHLYQDALSFILRNFPYDSPLHSQASFLTIALHTTASMAFPSKHHRKSTYPKLCHPHQPWYDDICKQLQSQVNSTQSLPSPHLRHLKCLYSYTRRCKKRIYETFEGKRLVDLLYSSSSGAFWLEFMPRAPPPLLRDLRCGIEYATVLYTFPTDPIVISPSTFSFFTPTMVSLAVEKIKTHRARDIKDLESELLIHATDILSPVLASLLNQAIISGFSLQEW